MNGKKKILTAALVMALVGALALPAMAGALPGQAQNMRRAARAAAAQAKMAGGQAVAQLTKRITNVLRARKARFDAVAANLEKRIARLDQISAKIAAAGGDVSGANAKIDEARQHLAKAKELEQTAIDKFSAIITAGDRKAAFREARAAGRTAVAELALTRVSIREPAGLLRGAVEDIRAEEASETTNAQ